MATMMARTLFLVLITYLLAGVAGRLDWSSSCATYLGRAQTLKTCPSGWGGTTKENIYTMVRNEVNPEIILSGPLGL